jgi:hypothetical protein
MKSFTLACGWVLSVALVACGTLPTASVDKRVTPPTGAASDDGVGLGSGGFVPPPPPSPNRQGVGLGPGGFVGDGSGFGGAPTSSTMIPGVGLGSGGRADSSAVTVPQS